MVTFRGLTLFTTFEKSALKPAAQLITTLTHTDSGKPTPLSRGATEASCSSKFELFDSAKSAMRSRSN